MAGEITFSSAFFWRECIEEAPGRRTSGGDLYDAYLRWSSRRGTAVVGRNEFYTALTQKAVKVREHRTAVAFVGIALRSECEYA